MKTTEMFFFCFYAMVNNVLQIIFLKIVERDKLSFSDTGKEKEIINDGEKNGIFTCITTGESPDLDPLKRVRKLFISEKKEEIYLIFDDNVWILRKRNNTDQTERFDNLLSILS